jgi:hypothetical protein
MSTFVAPIDAFNRAGVSYVIVGGLATVLHGHARMTTDVDFVIRLDRDNVTKALETIEMLGYRPRLPIDPAQFADEQTRQSWIRDKGLMVLSFYDPQDVTQNIDLFAEYPMDYDQLFGRSIIKSLSNTPTRICSLDDLLAMKRAADRPIDRADVKELEEFRKNG